MPLEQPAPLAQVGQEPQKPPPCINPGCLYELREDGFWLHEMKSFRLGSQDDLLASIKSQEIHTGLLPIAKVEANGFTLNVRAAVGYNHFILWSPIDGVNLDAKWVVHDKLMRAHFVNDSEVGNTECFRKVMRYEFPAKTEDGRAIQPVFGCIYSSATALYNAFMVALVRKTGAWEMSQVPLPNIHQDGFMCLGRDFSKQVNVPTLDHFLKVWDTVNTSHWAGDLAWFRGTGYERLVSFDAKNLKQVEVPWPELPALKENKFLEFLGRETL